MGKFYKVERQKFWKVTGTSKLDLEVIQKDGDTSGESSKINSKV